MIEEALVDYLLAQEDLTAYVRQEIRPHLIPQESELPCVTVVQLVPGSVTSLGGSSGLAGSTIRITAWATTWPEAKDVADRVFQALRNVRPTVWSGVRIYGVEISEGDEAADPSIPLAQVIRDYRIWHRE